MNGIDILFTAALSLLVLFALVCVVCVVIDTAMGIIRYKDAKCTECLLRLQSTDDEAKEVEDND